LNISKTKRNLPRLDLEKEFNLSTGRAYWHVKNLLDKKIIKNTESGEKELKKE